MSAALALLAEISGHRDGAGGAGVNAGAAIHAAIANLGFAVIHGDHFSGAGTDTGFASGAGCLIDDCGHGILLLWVVGHRMGKEAWGARVGLFSLCMVGFGLRPCAVARPKASLVRSLRSYGCSAEGLARADDLFSRDYPDSVMDMNAHERTK